MTKGEETRQRIIAQAAPIFSQRGFEGTSLAELMEATGLEKGGIYRHFVSKEELAADALRYALGRSERTRTDDVEEIDGAVEKLRFLVRRFVEGRAGMAGGCPLMNAAIDADDGNAVLRGVAADGFRDWRGRLEAIVGEGVRLGEIRAGTDARRVANGMIAALEGALMMSRLERCGRPLEDAGEMLDGMLKGIAEG